MDALGLKAAIQELAKDIGPEQAAFFNRLDLSVQNAVNLLDELLTKHEGKLAGKKIVISLEDK